MIEKKQYFFCGVGGSGMLPLAMIVKARGHIVEGSDRALDQGRLAEKFKYLRSLGVELHLQDGSGVSSPAQIVVASTAVEDSVPDLVAAKKIGAQRLSRAELLAQLFNDTPCAIGVAGTSGKSTTTAMLGWILTDAELDPTIMNGAVMKNFASPDALFASARVGRGNILVSEVDESDGSIALFHPSLALLNNIALDHKSMDELRDLFGAFVDKADQAVLNLDNEETARLAKLRTRQTITYSLRHQDANYLGSQIMPSRNGVTFTVTDNLQNDKAQIALRMPGRHNVSNALAALAAAGACGVDLHQAAAALEKFEGVKRRLEYVGEAGGVTLIDDFAHNPDKISASLAALHEFEGRLLVMFQPHGFGPLKKMKSEFIEIFVNNLGKDDILLMPEPLYFGGTVDRAVSSADIAAGVRARGGDARAFETREASGEALLQLAAPGDRIIIMGARDDTLSQFAAGLLDRLSR